jgi:peptide chain release factor subunit 1
MIDSLASATEKVRDLAAAHSPRGEFLTVTLSTSPLDDWRQVAPTFLNSEFTRLIQERGASKDQKHILQRELDEIGAVLQYDLTDRTQGLALFADGTNGVYARIELPFRLANRVVLEPAPYVRPVLHALSLLEPFIVARVSRDESNVYLVNEWGLAKEDDLTGPWLKTSDPETGELSIKEYFAAARHDTLVELHYKEVAGVLAKWLESSEIRRVVLCAQHEIASNFRRELAPAVAPKVVAEIPFDAAVSVNQMIATARVAANEARHVELVQLVERIREGLGANGRGAGGFEEVEDGLKWAQIQTMVVDRNYRPPGWSCPECNWVGVNPVEHCPTCEEAPIPIGDAVGELMRIAILQRSRVEVAENLPELDQMGRIAALLRFA